MVFLFQRACVGLGQALGESDAEHGDGPSCHYTVWTSGAQTCALNTSISSSILLTKSLQAVACKFPELSEN